MPHVELKLHNLKFVICIHRKVSSSSSIISALSAVVITVIKVSKFSLYLHIRADLFIDTITFALADYCQHL